MNGLLGGKAPIVSPLFGAVDTLSLLFTTPTLPPLKAHSMKPDAQGCWQVGEWCWDRCDDRGGVVLGRCLGGEWAAIDELVQLPQGCTESLGLLIPCIAPFGTNPLRDTAHILVHPPIPRLAINGQGLGIERYTQRLGVLANLVDTGLNRFASVLPLALQEVAQGRGTNGSKARGGRGLKR